MAPATNTESAADAKFLLDLAIIGAGPAALAAATYAARAGLSVTVFGRGAIGGALAEISHISNFPGFDGPGPDLAKAMREQAASAGAQLAYGECTDIHADADHFILTIDGESHSARTVLIATGSEPRPLDPHLEQAITQPISYCALCDGDLVKGQHVAVIGGANSALQEALYLANLATDVTIISHSAVKADAILQDRVAATENITILPETEPTADLLNQYDHIFVFIGKRPATSFLQNLPHVTTDDQGYLCTTSVDAHATPEKGLFVAGDVRSGALRQAITAAADGAAAAVEITKYLS